MVSEGEISEFHADGTRYRSRYSGESVVPHHLVTPPDLDLLRWYLEIFPTSANQAARNRAERIEKLLSVFENRLAEELPRIGPNEIFCIESARSAVHALPWELVEAHGGENPTGPIVRSVRPNSLKTSEVLSELRVLIVVARPLGGRDVPPLPIASSIADALGTSIPIDVLLAASLDALKIRLAEAKAEGRPFTVVHFDVHGAHTSDHRFGFVFERAAGGRHFVLIDDLAPILGESGVQMAVANACRSGRPSYDGTGAAALPNALLRAGLSAVIAFAYDLRADAAPIFTRRLYGCLAEGYSVAHAIRQARTALREDKARRTSSGFTTLNDWWSPVAYIEADLIFRSQQNASPDPSEVDTAPSMRPVEDAAYETLAALLEGKNVALGGLCQSGQALAANLALNILKQLRPSVPITHVNWESWRASTAVGGGQDDQEQRVIAMTLNDQRPSDLIETLQQYVSANPNTRLLLVCDFETDALPAAIAVGISALPHSDFPYALVDAGIDDYDEFSDILAGRSFVNLSRILTCAGLATAFLGIVAKSGLEDADAAVISGIRGDGDGCVLAESVRRVASRIDWKDTLTRLAAISPVSMPLSLFRASAETLGRHGDLEGWIDDAACKGLARVEGDRIRFHPLLDSEILRYSEQYDAADFAEVVSASLVSVTSSFSDFPAVLNTESAGDGIRKVSSQFEAIERAIQLALEFELLGPARWARYATPLLQSLAEVRRRRGEREAFARFAQSIRRHYRGPPYQDDEALFWLTLLRESHTGEVSLKGLDLDHDAYLLVVESRCRDLIERRSFTEAEQVVRDAINQIASRGLQSERLYTLIAEIGERRGWPLMALNATTGAIRVFDEAGKSAPPLLSARRILGEARRSLNAFEAKGRSAIPTPSIEDIPREVEEAEWAFRMHGEEPGVADALTVMTRLKLGLGECASALRFGDQALRIAERHGDDWRRASVLTTLGDAWLGENAVESGRLYFMEAARSALQIGDKRLEAAAFAGIAETSFRLGQTTLSPIGTSAYQELERAFECLAEWGATEAPQAHMRSSFDRVGPVLSTGTTTMTAFQELMVPVPEVIRVTEVARSFASADATGETIWLVGSYLDTLAAFDPVSPAIGLLGTVHTRLESLGKTTPDIMRKILAIAARLPPTTDVSLLNLLGRMAGSVEGSGDPENQENMIELIVAHTDERAPHSADLRDASIDRWVLVRYRLASMLMSSNETFRALQVVEDVVINYLDDEDINAGNVFNLYGILLFFQRRDKPGAVAAWEKSKFLKTKKNQNTESVDYNLSMAETNDPPREGGTFGPAWETRGPSEIAKSIKSARTPTELLQVHNTWQKQEHADVHRALAEAYLDRLEAEPGTDAAMLLSLGRAAASKLTDFASPEAAENLLTRCISLSGDENCDLRGRHLNYNNRSYARLMLGNREGARNDADEALRLISEPDYPAEDRVHDLAVTHGNRNNSAESARDQLAVAVRIAATLEKFNLWADADLTTGFLRQIVSNHPRGSFESLWRAERGEDPPPTVLRRIGEILF